MGGAGSVITAAELTKSFILDQITRENASSSQQLTDLRRLFCFELSFAATPHLTRHFPYPARVSTKSVYDTSGARTS